MKQKIFFLIALFLIINSTSFSQTPTYTLNVDSMRLNTINNFNDAIEFGVYLTHTNAPTAFNLAGQQIFFSFNPGILQCSNYSDTNCVKYRIIGSQLPAPYQPRGPSVSTATNPTATVLRLAINAFQGAPGLNITGVVNLLIVRMRLTKSGGSFNNVGCSSGTLSGLNLAWRNPPVVAFSSKVFAYIANVNTDITTPATHTIDSTCYPPQPSSTVLKLKVIPEGLYFPLFNQMSRRDTVRTYLRNITTPYSVVDSAKDVIDSVNFMNWSVYNNTPTGRYYIAVKHFNTIETWSKSGGEQFTLGDITIYDFTTANTQAYGNNLKLKGGKYCMYSGDVVQDGFIDGSDFIVIENDAYFFRTGRFIPSDLNGDNFVDATDAQIGDNNRSIFVITP